MLYDIKVLHLELSSFCNARCPTCVRNVQGFPYNQGFEETNLTLADCKKIFSPVFLSQLKKILIDGNFGDFVMNPESLDIIKYFFQNFTGEILVDTNGSHRDLEFWKELGRLGITVFFNLDGTAETHCQTRPDTDFDTILENAQHFIDQGGNAIWKMSVTDRNRHLIEEADMMSIKMGFTNFITQELHIGENVTYDTSGKKVYYFKEDPFWPDYIDHFLIKKMIDGPIGPGITRKHDIKINCQSVLEKTIYVAADGHVYPCSWTGMNPTKFKPHSRNPYQLFNPDFSKYVENNHAPTVGLESAVGWFHELDKAWTSSEQPLVCQYFCGSKK